MPTQKVNQRLSLSEINVILTSVNINVTCVFKPHTLYVRDLLGRPVEAYCYVPIRLNGQTDEKNEFYFVAQTKMDSADVPCKKTARKIALSRLKKILAHLHDNMLVSSDIRKSVVRREKIELLHQRNKENFVKTKDVSTALKILKKVVCKETNAAIHLTIQRDYFVKRSLRNHSIAGMEFDKE